MEKEDEQREKKNKGQKRNGKAENTNMKEATKRRTLDFFLERFNLWVAL
jgi:hypothetical protein